MRMAPPQSTRTGGRGWADFIRVTAPGVPQATIEQLETVTCDGPSWRRGQVRHDACSRSGRKCAGAIVTDNVTGFPAVSTAACRGRAWCRPTARDARPEIPRLLGHPSTTAATGRVPRGVTAVADPRSRTCPVQPVEGRRAATGGSFQYDSPGSTVPLPGVIDYPRATRSGPWHRLETLSARATRVDISGGCRVRQGRPTSRWAASAAWNRLMQRITTCSTHGAPRHRSLGLCTGAATRRAHVRRAVPSADLDPPAVRPADHARGTTPSRRRSTSACR